MFLLLFSSLNINCYFDVNFDIFHALLFPRYESFCRCIFGGHILDYSTLLLSYKARQLSLSLFWLYLHFTALPLLQKGHLGIRP